MLTDDTNMKNNSLCLTLNTFFLCILTMLCSSCLFLGELKPKRFSNVFAGGCYLESFDALYLLVGIIKVREEKLNHFFVSPQFGVSYTKEILFMIKVKDNGNVEVQSHLLNSPMSGFYVASGIKLIKAENDILIFDTQESYLLKDDKLIPFDASSNKKLALVINEYQAKGNWKILEEWNRQNKCHHDEISNLYFAPYEQNINWKDHVITIRRNRHNYDEKDRVIISISCKDLLNSPILLVIPIENRESYSTPDFIELPYIIINDNLHPFSTDNPLIFQ